MFLYARAGGGGGNNFGRALGMLIGLINAGLIIYYVKKRNKKAKILIDESHENDPLWDYDKMIAFSNDVFYRMQNAWTERDMDLVKDIVTENLYLDYKKKLDWMKVTHSKNMIEDINIRTVKIVGDQDYGPNEFDSFTVYIKGKLVDYLISDKTAHIYENSRKKRTFFSDLYYFVRHEDHWLLDRIDNRVTLGKILNQKQVID